MAAGYLQLRFARGERPHWFWVSDQVVLAEGAARYKVLSKRRPDGALEVLVIEERIGGERRILARRALAPEMPAGWLEHWVDELAEALGAKFHAFDLRGIANEHDWRETAERLGWA